MPKYNEHTFWCINCGNQALPLLRPNSRTHEKFHRKKLYCYHCKQDINCIECKNDLEVQEFKEQFQNGDFKEEAQSSLQYIAEELISEW